MQAEGQNKKKARKETHFCHTFRKVLKDDPFFDRTCSAVRVLDSLSSPFVDTTGMDRWCGCERGQCVMDANFSYSIGAGEMYERNTMNCQNECLELACPGEALFDSTGDTEFDNHPRHSKKCYCECLKACDQTVSDS